MKVSEVFFPFDYLCYQFRYVMQTQCTYTKVRGDRMYVKKKDARKKDTLPNRLHITLHLPPVNPPF